MLRAYACSQENIEIDRFGFLDACRPATPPPKLLMLRGDCWGFILCREACCVLALDVGILAGCALTCAVRACCVALGHLRICYLRLPK